MAIQRTEENLMLGGSRLQNGLVLAARDAWETAATYLPPDESGTVAVRVHNALGTLFLELHRPEKAMQHFAQAKALCDRAGVGTGVAGRVEHARVLNNLALTHVRGGDLDQAIELAQQSVAMANGLDEEPELKAAIHLVTGVCLLDKGAWSEARFHMEHSLGLFRELGAARGEAMCLNNLGIIALESGEWSAAQGLLEASLSVLQRVHDVGLSAYARTELGRLHFRQDQLPQALHHGSIALRNLWDNMGLLDRAEVARLCGLFGSIFSVRGDRAAALSYLQRATTYFAQSQMWREWGQATKELDRLIKRRELPRERVIVEWQDQELLRYLTTLLGLMDTLESLYPESFRTAELVTKYALILGKAIGVEESRLAQVSNAARLRDVGLTSESEIASGDRTLGGGHPLMGERILTMFGVPQAVRLAVRYHHEHFDGSGYPEGLVGEAIPLEARILGLVQAYVAAVEGEVERGPGFHERAIASLVSNEFLFDPDLLSTFLQLHGEE